MKKALITGITGQDGSYLAEFLLDKGYEVHGITRRASISNTARIDHLLGRIRLHDGDLTDSSSLIRIIGLVQPDEIYNLAAQSHVQVSFDVPEYSGDVDALGVLRILEACRILGLAKKTRVYQASTSELFGKVEEVPQRETTPFHPYSPYAVAKQYGYWIVKEYREAYGMFAVNGILFNHESERRGENFVTRKITLADFLYDNMILEMNVIHAAWQNGCRKLEFLGSSCIYPRMAPQPMKEDCLLTSALEKTNEAYALAKISGLKYCEFLNRQYGTDYISVMPTNLYGPNDNYHPTHSHVLPALIRRFHEAKVQNLPSVTCWGDGSPLREFLYVDDLANLCVFLMNHYSGNETVNAGTGKELTIRELTELVAKVVGYEGEILWDPSKPNGTPRKLLDVSKAASLGWTYRTELPDGIRLAYEDFLNNPIRAER